MRLWPKLPLLSCGLAALLSAGNSWAQSPSPLIEQLKFTAVELLIYTDQLQRFEGTRCRTGVISHYNRVATQEQLLEQLKPEHREPFKQLFSSALINQLLVENGRGIEAMLGPQQVLTGPASLNPKQRAECRQMAAVFQDNYLQTEADLQQLFERYRDL